MGVMQFQLPADATITPAELAAAHLTGLDGRVYPAAVTVEEGLLTLRRDGCASGRLHLAWPVAGGGGAGAVYRSPVRTGGAVSVAS